jgi:hypothetical protein
MKTQPQRARKRRPLPPPIPRAKDKSPQPTRSTEVVPSTASLPPAANRKMNRLCAFVERERAASITPLWRNWLHQVPIWIWPSLVGGGLAGIVTWALLATPEETRAISQGDSHPGIRQAAPSNAAASNVLADTRSASSVRSIPEAAESLASAMHTETAMPLKTLAATTRAENAGASKDLSDARIAAFFNGVDLAGWEASNGCWRVEGGLLVGSVAGTEKVLAVLRSKQTYRDFDLRFRVRLKGGAGNCALRFRAHMDGAGGATDTGAQCVIRQAGEDKAYAIGSLIDCSTDTHEVAEASGKAAAFAKPGDFNQVQVRCEGETVVVRVNRIMTACKKLASMPEEGVIVFELDGRQQPGEVTFKDFKFTDLTRSGTVQKIVRPASESGAILRAEADYRQSRELARKKLLSSFDSAIKQRLSQSNQPDGKHTGTVAIIEAEKEAFSKKGHIPWSRSMRSATRDYLSELEQAQQRMEKSLGDESDAAMQRGDRNAVVELEDLGNKILAPHLVATARFAGTRISFRSDGIIENSNDDAPRRWWISDDKHDAVIIELDSDSDDAKQEVFRIGENGATRHQWVFVDK